MNGAKTIWTDGEELKIVDPAFAVALQTIADRSREATLGKGLDMKTNALRSQIAGCGAGD